MEKSKRIQDYKLPIIDVCEEKRNFPGYQKDEYYTLDQIQEGDCSGITETDSQTSGKEDGEYSTINETSGKVRPWDGKQLGFEPKYDSHVHVDRDQKKVTPQVGNTMNRGR